MPTQAEKAQLFRELHTGNEPFIIPNPWDAGSARVLVALGFKALATTSSGLAMSIGKADGALVVTRDEVLANAKTIVEATALPVSADLENLYAHDPTQAATTIGMAADVGLVGCSIEDWSGDSALRIYDFSLAVERVSAAVEAARSLSIPFTLTARAENLIRGRNDLDDTIRRLQAFEAAGADVLYAPGLNDVETLKTVVESLNKPFNALASPNNTHLTLADYAAAGVARVSVGGALARVAVGAFVSVAENMAQNGSFDGAQHAIAFAKIDALLAKGAD